MSNLPFMGCASSPKRPAAIVTHSSTRGDHAGLPPRRASVAPVSGRSYTELARVASSSAGGQPSVCCEQAFLERLREHGLRLTPQRVAILSVMHDLEGHASAEEIHARVQQEADPV